MEFLVVGGIVFWAYVALCSVLFVVTVATDSDVWGMVVIAAGLLVARELFSLDYPGTLPNTVGGWLIVAACYLPIGLLWSFFKFYVTYRAQMKRLKAGFAPGPAYQTWNEYLEKFPYVPRASEMKADIISWIACWPVSVMAYVLADLLSDLLNKIYDWFSGVYERMATRIRDSFKD